MDESVFQQPTLEQLKQFVAGDPLAIDAVTEMVLPQLYRWAARRYPTVFSHDRDSIINDVLSETVQHHERYDSSRSLFTTYIIALIEKRMKTVLKKQLTIVGQQESLETVSENFSQAMYDTVEEDVMHRLDRDEFYGLARRHLSALEGQFLNLMRQGEIHNPPFIEILRRFGITKTTGREVSNTKERVKYKLTKFAHSRGLRLEDYL